MDEKPKVSKKTKLRAARARQQRAEEAGRVANASSVLDTSFFGSDQEGSLTPEEELQRAIIGIQMPSLALRYMFGFDVFPLGRCISFNGIPGSGKTAALFELFRWFTQASGGGLYIENENKEAQPMRLAILEYNAQHYRNIKEIATNSQEAWMTEAGKFFDEQAARFARIKKVARKPKREEYESIEDYRVRCAPKTVAKNAGWIKPILVGVDSLTGTGSEAAIEKIKDDGAPGRTWAMEANFLTQWNRALPDRLRGTPQTFAATAHNKPFRNDRGIMEDRVPGGWSPNFMDVLRVRCQRLGAVPLHPDHGGIKIEWKLIKNSMGEGGHKIEVVLKWWYEENPTTGRMVQRMAFDWDTAAIDVLLAQRRFGAPRMKKIMDVCDLHEASQGRVWSKTLGIKSDSPVKLAEAGQALESRPDLLDALYDLLHIERRTQMIPGVPYEDVEAQLQRQIERDRPVFAPRDLAGGDFLNSMIKDIKDVPGVDGDDDDD